MRIEEDAVHDCHGRASVDAGTSSDVGPRDRYEAVSGGVAFEWFAALARGDGLQRSCQQIKVERMGAEYVQPEQAVGISVVWVGEVHRYRGGTDRPEFNLRHQHEIGGTRFEDATRLLAPDARQRRRPVIGDD